MEDVKKMNKDIDVVKYKKDDIENLIYTIRGKQVMLDSDVANLYQYKTKSLNLAVKRNIERFPEEFCFQLTENELESLRFQIETSKREKNNLSSSRGGRRYLPYAFTEQGVAMLAGILKSDIAVEISIKIIKAFGISFFGSSISSANVDTTSKPKKLNIITDKNDNPVVLFKSDVLKIADDWFDSSFLDSVRLCQARLEVFMYFKDWLIVKKKISTNHIMNQTEFDAWINKIVKDRFIYKLSHYDFEEE